MTIHTKYDIGDMVQPRDSPADQMFEIAEIQVRTQPRKSHKPVVTYRRTMGCWFAESELKLVYGVARRDIKR